MKLGCFIAFSVWLLVLPSSAFAQDATSFNGAIFEGTCENPDRPVSQLVTLSSAAGEIIGNTQYVPAINSFSSVQVPLEALTSTNHAVIVTADLDEVAACGDIGGPLTEAGALIIGLSPREGSDVTGIAFLTPSTELAQTDISLFLTGDGARPDSQVDGAQAVEASGANSGVPEDEAAGLAASDESELALPTQLPQTADSTDPVVSAPQAAQPTTGLSAAEQAYLDEVQPIVTTVTDSLNRSAALFGDPQIFSDEWKIDLAVELAIWRASYAEAAAITPPPALAEMHYELVEALRLMDEASYDVAAGVDTFDTALLQQALTKIEQANLHIQAANRLLEEFSRERLG